MTQAQIFIDKDEWRGTKPLHQFIMHLLMENGVSGATSFEGYSAYGRNHRLKQPTRQYSFDETPMLITFVDDTLKVKRVLTELRKEYRGGFIITHPVESW